MKKFILIFIGLLSLGVLSYFLFTENISKQKAHLGNIWEAVPPNSSFLVHINDVQQFNSNIDSTEYKKEFNQLTFASSLLEFVANIDSSLTAYNLDIAFNQVYASYHLSSVGKMSPVLYLHSAAKNRQVKKLATLLSSDKNFKVNSWEYSDNTIIELTNIDLGFKMAMAFVDGIIIASQTSFLVEDAINELINKDNKLTNKESFKSLWQNSSNAADMTIAFCYNNLPLWLSTFLQREYINLFDDYKDLAEWSLIDLYFNKDGIFYTGNTTTSKHNLLSNIKGNQPLPYELLPANTAFFYQQILPANKTAIWKGDHFIKVQGEVMDDQFERNAFLFINSSEPEANTDYLKEVAASTQLEKDTFYYKDHLIASIWNDSIIQEITGLSWGKDKQLYYCHLKDYVVFSKVKYALEFLIEQINNEETLSKSISFDEFIKNMALEGEINTYMHTGLLHSALQDAASNIISDEVDELIESLSHFRQLSLSYKREKALCLTSGYALYSKEIESREDMLWRLKLEAPVLGEPVIVEDAVDQSKYLFVQDTSKMIYLLNRNGQVLWSKDVKAPVVGNIYSADYYGNNKTCFLLSTTDEVYWFDHLGQSIADFPMRLPDKTNAGLTMVMNKGKIRFYVPVNNGNIYGYSANGKPLDGWNPKSDVGQLKHPIKVINYKNKLQLIAANTRGNVYSWDVNGKASFKTVRTGQLINNDFAFDRSSVPEKLKTITKGGKVMAVTLNGQLTTDQLNFPFPVEYFTMAEIDGNSNGYEIVVAGDDCVSLCARTGKELFKKCDNSSNAQYVLTQLPYNGSYAIGITNTVSSVIQFIDSKGEIIDFLPKESFSGGILTDLFGSGQNNIIGWKDNTVTAYRLSNGDDR